MGSSQKDINTLFLAFYEVLLFCEGLKSSCNAKIMFKSAQILEDTVTKLQSIEAVEDFQLKLNEFWAIKGLSPTRVEYFQNASCLVLQRVLSDNQFSDLSVSEAIIQFLQIKSEAEFLECLKTQSHMQKAVEKLKSGFNLCEDLMKYKAIICLEELKTYVVSVTRNEENLSNVEHITKDYEFKTLLKVLCLPHECELDLHVQNLISVSVSKALSNLDDLSNHDHVFDMEKDELNLIVHRWPSILQSLLRVVEFSIRHLQCDYEDRGTPYSWKYFGAKRGVTFNCITVFISKLNHSSDLQIHLKKLLDVLKNDGCAIIVEDILRISKLS